MRAKPWSHDTLNILFLTQLLPYPLVSGAKIRAYFMLRQLAQRHDLTLVSFIRDDDEPEHLDHLREHCRAVHTIKLSRSFTRDVGALLRSLLTSVPAVIARDRHESMELLLLKLTGSQEFDLVHADQTSMAQYGLFVYKACPDSRKPRLLLDQHNALYLVVHRQAEFESGWRRLLWQSEARRLGQYERSLCRRFDHILTVTDEDRDALLRLMPPDETEITRPRITALPICVDVSPEPLPQAKDSEPTIIHLGTMFWPPNIEGVLWFAEHVYPLILQKVPNAALFVVGKNPPERIKSLASSASPPEPQIRVTGYVADPAPLLSQSHVFVVPVKAGGGMRVKILDAWNWGIPVVSTTIGAEGIDTLPGENILLADEPEAFAAAVARLLLDSDFSGRMRENGRRWVRRHYDWRKVYPKVVAIYDRLAS